MSAERPLAEYFEQATSWDADRSAQADRSKRIAWRVALAACICVVILSGALLALIPLKRVEPYVIRVDSRTGVVEVVPAYTGGEDFNQAIARYFLMRYISVCERFDYPMARADYRQCGAFNSAPLNQALYTRWNPANPRSPLNVHRDGSTVSVRIEAVSFLGGALGGGHLAQVRFERITRQPGGTRERLGHWIATVQYRFGPPARAMQLRRWNPLGFEVTALELEPEVLGSAGGTGG